MQRSSFGQAGHGHRLLGGEPSRKCSWHPSQLSAVSLCVLRTGADGPDNSCMSTKLLHLGIIALGFVVFLASAVAFIWVGLEDADKLASVLSFVAGLAGVCLSAYGLVAARQDSKAQSAQSVADSIVGGEVNQISGVGGKVTIRRTPPSTTSNPGGLPGARNPAPSQSPGQSVVNSAVSGPVHQIHDVGEAELGQ